MLYHIALFFLFTTAFQGKSQISPPAQPLTGPGGNNYSHQSVIKSSKYGSGDFAFWIYEPSTPKPDSANLVIFNHGWGASNPVCYGKWLGHIVRKGNIVIFPKWQDNTATLPSTFTPNAAKAIRDAVDTLTNGSHVNPRLSNTAIIGHSYGGVISANISVLADSLGLPKPKATLLAEPGTGGASSGLLPSYKNFPDMKLLVVVGENDVVVGDTIGRMIYDSSVFVNPNFKSFVTQYYDGHGYPYIEATHNEPLAIDSYYDTFEYNTFVNASFAVSKTDAVDFFCYWKFTDAILDCAFYGINCEYAFCNTPQQRLMGKWSDNQQVKELKIETTGLCISSSGASNIIADADVKVYPNPVVEKIIFNVVKKANEKYVITIANSLGEIVSQTSSSSQTSELDVSLLPFGVYHYSIQSERWILKGKFAIIK